MKKNAFTNFIDDFKKFKEDVKASDNKVKTVIPNLLTFSRLFAPLFTLSATLLGNFPLALTFAALFALTDAFDGFLARKWKVTSEFGKNLDPICDKFFVLGIIIPFMSNPSMVLTLALEAVISFVNLKSAFKNNEPRSTYLGKGKTVLLSLLITLSYLFKALGISLDALLPLAVITNVVQTVTAIDYMNIDNKKDIVKEVKEIVNTNEEENIKQNENQINSKLEKVEELTETQKELLEYRQIRRSFTEEEKTTDKTIGQITRQQKDI